ncbi:MAG: hypothetical protein ACXABY_04880 [Candidatus Thorarchaeota archaeon]|jgi:hypothetical protein
MAVYDCETREAMMLVEGLLRYVACVDFLGNKDLLDTMKDIQSKEGYARSPKRDKEHQLEAAVWNAATALAEHHIKERNE